MANNLVYSWADKLRQKNPPRNYMPARYASCGSLKEYSLHFFRSNFKKTNYNTNEIETKQ